MQMIQAEDSFSFKFDDRVYTFAHQTNKTLDLHVNNFETGAGKGALTDCAIGTF